ncbi:MULTISPECIES: exodeoxyribonuclease VII small subunit [Halobacteriales]|uniref:Exodeoxyribonuclease VII small subunit n=1 Tax=Halorubrum trueperi TaxID=2004704 RepID=A0ABD5UN16_9EURY|nr:exodeoxyribonuclease VII small subunit [Halobacterium salinarum]MDL0121780.1 exodeoxyribonuclease VII small subunit [Halobacterium salinarum]
MAKDSEIHDRLSRVEEIIEQLDADECDLDEGTALHEEGQELLSEVREILDEGSGEVVELE